MMNTLTPSKIPAYKKLILLVSVVIPIVVGILFTMKKIPGNLSFLPPIYAGFNAATAMLLISALVAIKNGWVEVHRMFVRLALMLSLLFLVCYVAYHLTSDPTYYGDIDHNGILSEAEKIKAGSWRIIYFITLISHVGLSMVVIPLVLFSYLNAWAGNYEKHKQLVRFSFPIWLYVAITGVLVYWMISPYYG